MPLGDSAKIVNQNFEEGTKQVSPVSNERNKTKTYQKMLNFENTNMF